MPGLAPRLKTITITVNLTHEPRYRPHFLYSNSVATDIFRQSCGGASSWYGDHPWPEQNADKQCVGAWQVQPAGSHHPARAKTQHWRFVANQRQLHPCHFYICHRCDHNRFNDWSIDES